MKIIKVRILKDDKMPGFAGFLAGSQKKGTPLMYLNVYSTLACAVDNDIKAKEIVIENLMHEFGHLLEEEFGKAFDEDFMDRCTQSYREKYANR